jgi:hypothetical protein
VTITSTTSDSFIKIQFPVMETSAAVTFKFSIKATNAAGSKESFSIKFDNYIDCTNDVLSLVGISPASV